MGYVVLRLVDTHHISKMNEQIWNLLGNMYLPLLFPSIDAVDDKDSIVVTALGLALVMLYY